MNPSSKREEERCVDVPHADGGLASLLVDDADGEVAGRVKHGLHVCAGRIIRAGREELAGVGVLEVRGDKAEGQPKDLRGRGRWVQGGGGVGLRRGPTSSFSTALLPDSTTRSRPSQMNEFSPQS